MSQPRPPLVRMTARRLYQLVDRRRTPQLFEEVARLAPRLGRIRPFGQRDIWVASHPDLARHLLVDVGRSVCKGEALQVMTMLLGNGLLTADGDEHRRHRRLVQPAFHHERLARYAAVMVDQAMRTGAGWRDGDVRDVAADMSALTLAVVGLTLLGSDTTERAAEVGPALGTVLRHFPKAFIPGMLRLFDSPLPWAVDVRRSISRLDGLVRDLVADRRRRGSGDDVLSVLLATQQTDDPLEDEEIRDEVMTLLLAGHETTAVALTWTWWLLDRHPAAAGRLRAELAGVLRGRVASYADLPRLPYTNAVVAESLRLHPPAWMLERQAATEFRLDGYRVPPGATLLASPWVIQRDPRFWVDPARFRPERWLTTDGRYDESAPGQPKGAYFPFGAGSRVCIGGSFAWTEAVLVLATLAADWAPVRQPEQRVAPYAAVTLRPAYGMRMRLRRVAGPDRPASAYLRQPAQPVG